MRVDAEDFSNEEPRFPEVPNATRCSGTEGSGASV